MHILFLIHPYPNYVPDLLLHGLRKLLGSRVVDYPRKDCLYEGFLGTGVADESQLLKGWFPQDADIDRQDIPEKIRKGYFKYIIADIRAVHNLCSFKDAILINSTLVIVDGEDAPQRIPYGKYIICRRETDGSDFSIPLPMALPEEVFEIIAGFDSNEKTHSIGFLGSFSGLCDERGVIIDAIAKRYSDAMLAATPVPSVEKPMPGGRLGRREYYSALQRCKIVLNMRGAGFDTFRFWENCACKGIHLSQRMPLYRPFDFVEGCDILQFSGTDELFRHVDSVLDETINADAMITQCRNKLLTYHSTTKRAEYLLKKLSLLTD